jgi:hypothetical protein
VADPGGPAADLPGLGADVEVAAGQVDGRAPGSSAAGGRALHRRRAPRQATVAAERRRPPRCYLRWRHQGSTVGRDRCPTHSAGADEHRRDRRKHTESSGCCRTCTQPLIGASFIATSPVPQYSLRSWHWVPLCTSPRVNHTQSWRAYSRPPSQSGPGFLRARVLPAAIGGGGSAERVHLRSEKVLLAGVSRAGSG